MSRKKVGRYARKVREAVEKGVVSCCTTFNPCTVKVRINTKAARHVKVAKSHEKEKERTKKSGLAKFADLSVKRS